MVNYFPNSSKNRPNSYYVWRRAALAFGTELVGRAKNGSRPAIVKLKKLAIAGRWTRLVRLLDEVAEGAE